MGRYGEMWGGRLRHSGCALLTPSRAASGQHVALLRAAIAYGAAGFRQRARAATQRAGWRERVRRAAVVALEARTRRGRWAKHGVYPV